MPPRAEPIQENEKKKHARLPAQMPASRVPKKPGGNNRQERKDAVSGRQDGNRGAGGKTARPNRKEIIRILEKTTVRS